MTKLRRPRRSWLLLLVGVVVGAGALGAVWGIATAIRPAPGVFTMAGALTLVGSNSRDASGHACTGSGGYSDIAEGASVTVYDAAGKARAIGSLQHSDRMSTGACSFAITVPNVPDGEQIYQVEVTHRGKVSVTADAAKAGLVSLRLGN